MQKINWKILLTTVLISSFLIFGQTEQTKRIKFAKGKSSATVRDSVLRDEVNYYLVKVGTGQRMTIKITSVANNASFRILKPSGEYVQGAGEMDDPKDWSGETAEPGDYKIEVGADRGNATYRLTVSAR